MKKAVSRAAAMFQRRTLTMLSRPPIPLAPLAATRSVVNQSLFTPSIRKSSTLPDPQESDKKPIPAPEAPNTEQESLMTRFIEGIKTGEFDEDRDKDILDMSVEALTKLVGATANSAVALVVMVPLLRLMIGARNQQPYSESIEKLKQVRLGQLIADGHLMLFRRVAASIIPAIFTETIGLTGFSAMFLNSTIETSISGFPKSEKSEPYQRFRTIHGSTFGFIPVNQNLINLTKDQYDKALKDASEQNITHYHYRVIDESIFYFIDHAEPKINLATVTEQEYKNAVEKFEELGGEVDKNASYAALRLSYKRMQVLQKNFTDNIPHQTALLALRNAAFASGIFLAKSGATEFVENASEILKEIGLEDKQIAVEIASLAIRIFFAISTAPIDNALTKLSSGEMSFAEFRKMEPSEQFSFRGAIARTTFVLCAFFTIVYGSETGEFIKEKFEESPLFIKTLEIMSKGFETHRQLKTGLVDNDDIELTEATNTLSTIMQFTDPKTKDEATEKKSIELLKFLLGDGDSKKSIIKLKEIKEFLSNVIDYIEKNPGLSAGIGKQDSDALLKRPSAHPSETKATTPETKTTTKDGLTK